MEWFSNYIQAFISQLPTAVSKRTSLRLRLAQETTQNKKGGHCPVLFSRCVLFFYSNVQNTNTLHSASSATIQLNNNKHQIIEYM